MVDYLALSHMRGVWCRVILHFGHADLIISFWLFRHNFFVVTSFCLTDISVVVLIKLWRMSFTLCDQTGSGSCGSPNLGSYHRVKTPNNFKTVAHIVACHFWQHLTDGLGKILGADALGGSYSHGLLKFVFVEVNSNDPGCTSWFTAHNDWKADSSEAKDNTSGTRGDLWREKFQ